MILDRAVALFIIVILTSSGIIWGLIDTRRIIEAPFLCATGMALILCPQMYVIACDSSRVPDEAFWVFSIMVVLCTMALYLGYFSPGTQPSRQPRSVADSRPIDHKRLYMLGCACVLMGVIGAYNLRSYDTTVAWRGWMVYWFNFLAFLVPGIILMLISYVRRPSVGRLCVIVMLSAIPLSWITDYGRRSATLTLPLMYLLPFMLRNKHLRISRWLVVVGLCFGFVVVYAFPVWRDQFKEHNYIQVVDNHPLSAIVDKMFMPGNTNVLEMSDGMIIAGARYQLGSYEWGFRDIYNELVQNYVPGALLGYDFKDSLRIGRGISDDWVMEAYGIPVSFYTAKSGYADLFSQFSFFGCIVLYWVGKGFRKAHDAAVYGHDGRAVIFLCLFISFPASIAYGGLTLSVVLALPLIALMLLAFWWCTVKPTACRAYDSIRCRQSVPRLPIAGFGENRGVRTL